MHIHGAEPRIFPGVLTRTARRESLRATGDGSMSEMDGSGSKTPRDIEERSLVTTDGVSVDDNDDDDEG